MKKILAKCKCGVYFTANEHKDIYEAAGQWLADCDETKDTDKEIIDEMIRRDTIYTLQFYPNTPIGSYKILHYDYDELIKQAEEILKEEERIPKTL